MSKRTIHTNLVGKWLVVRDADSLRSDWLAWGAEHANAQQPLDVFARSFLGNLLGPLMGRSGEIQAVYREPHGAIVALVNFDGKLVEISLTGYQTSTGTSQFFDICDRRGL